MNDLVLAGVAAAGAAVALAVALRLLHRPLAMTLLELCGEPHRAQFWTQMVTTALLAGTLSSALMGVLFASGQDAVHAVRALLRWLLLGMLGGVAVIAATVALFTLRHREHPCPPYGTGSVPAGDDRRRM
jgi:hypothetical protein